MKLVKPLLPIAVAAVVGGGAGAVATTALHDDSPSVITETRPISATPETGALSPHDVYESAKDSVAYITTGSGTGSGFVYSGDGYIVTNAHVVEGAGGQIKVKVGDGDTLDARLVGQDASTDLALLKVDKSGLKPLELADSSTVEVGDPAYAIGNPFGLDRTATAGIVSATDRHISAPNGFDIDDVIQTDAPINPGNSGGALVNMNGEVIGINTAIATQGIVGNIGVGFAISSNKAKSVTDQIRNGEPVSHPYLGVTIADAESGGALIQSVSADSPAEEAGLQDGDVVIRAGGRAIVGTEDLIAVIQATPVGTELSLTVMRDGDEVTVTATIAEQP